MVDWISESEYQSYVSGPLNAKKIGSTTAFPTTYANPLYILTSAGQKVGFIEVWGLDPHHEVGLVNFYVSRDSRQGLLGLEAILASLLVTFHELKLRKVNFYVATSNLPMRRVVDKLQVELEANMRCKAADASDLRVYAVFRRQFDEWMRRKSVGRMLNRIHLNLVPA